MKHYTREFEQVLKDRIQEPSRFIQLVSGPRQVGKTAGVQAVLEAVAQKKSLYLECEEAIHSSNWFLAQVQKAEETEKKIIVFDEIQKIEGWSELVKLAWDRQKRKNNLMHWILLGSSSLKLTQGASDSLAGRFEIIPVHHWGFKESEAAFGMTLDKYLDFGGYPAAYDLVQDQTRFRRYLLDSIFESVVSRDILRFVTVKKPALFRQTYQLACLHPAQVVSYNKFLGQLQEAGNVDQVKHYLDLYSQAYLIRLVFKYGKRLSRTSSPKLIPSAPVFTRLFLNRELTPEEKGFVFEGIVGKCLTDHFDEIYYWREGNSEVDYVVSMDGRLVGIEVKSKRRHSTGISDFRKEFAGARTVIIEMENYSRFEQDPKGFLAEFAI